MIESAGPWGTGPYQLVEGFSTPSKRSERMVLEANPHYWDRTRLPRVKRIVFDLSLRCIGTFRHGTPVLTAFPSQKDSKYIDT